MPVSKLSLSYAFLLVLLSDCLIFSSAFAQTNFSQREGFSQWRAQQRAQAHTTDLSDRALLHKHRPVFMLHREHPGLIDFYRDYIAHGELQLGNGQVVVGPVDAKTLNAHSQDPLAVFVHRASAQALAPGTVLARSDPVWIENDGSKQAFKLLTWHAVFRHSGLPMGLDGARGWLASVAGDVHDWHQLDHYTAVSVLLDVGDRPLAMMLQQHNYQRTYLFGEDLELPSDGRPVVDIAQRSNELFPHLEGAQTRRAVRFADADGMRYLMGFAQQPLMAANDITHGERAASYRLAFLPTDDAFYLFEGYLGEQRLLPGRDGPPGAGYNTIPALKPLELQLFSGYWRENSQADWQRFKRHVVQDSNRRAFAEAQREVFFANLRCLRASARVCHR